MQVILSGIHQDRTHEDADASGRRQMGMNFVSAVAVAGGAGIGALARWSLGLALDATWPGMPLGTLVANVVGGLLMGMLLGTLDQFQTLPVEWRLAITTGFLGGLTTFSTFTGETLHHVLRQQWGWAAALITAHVAGSLLAALIGFFLVRIALRH